MSRDAARTLKSIALLLGTLLAGCAHYAGGRVFESPRLNEPNAGFGRMKVIVIGNRWDIQSNDAKAEQSAVDDVLTKLKNTTIITHELRPADHDLSDTAALAEARADNAQSVCVISIGQSGGLFAIGLPELWALETKNLCTLRILDVPTGDLLLHSISFCQHGGPWEFTIPSAHKNLRSLLQRDLHPWLK